jgi:hypothetical protein
VSDDNIEDVLYTNRSICHSLRVVLQATMKNSIGDYIWVRFWIIALHSIAPASILYCVWLAFAPPSLHLPKVFTYLAFSEAAFYCLTCAYQQYYLQRPALHPAPTSKKERDTLFARCQGSTSDYQRYIEMWFLGESLTNIKRENVKQFFRWAFLNADVGQTSYNNDVDVDGYITKLESSLGRKFAPGHTDAKCLRLTMDKIDYLHRSLIWYMVPCSPSQPQYASGSRA